MTGRERSCRAAVEPCFRALVIGPLDRFTVAVLWIRLAMKRKTAFCHRSERWSGLSRSDWRRSGNSCPFLLDFHFRLRANGPWNHPAQQAVAQNQGVEQHRANMGEERQEEEIRQDRVGFS